MESLQSSNPNSQPAPTGANQEANIYEDEINLMDYFRVLWKRKRFILLGSIIPTLIVGLIIFFLPRDYTITYTYDVTDRTTMDVNNWNLDEKNYNVLLNRFYSKENLSRIIIRLQQEGFSKYAELISNAREAKELVKFEALPPFLDLSKAKVTDPAKLEQIRQLKALLLKLTITGRPKNDIPKISSVIRDNLENVIPVYFVEKQLNAATRECRANMADIEKNRFALELDLKTNESILAKLKKIKPDTLAKTESRITLQFDVGDRSEYLPIEYQIQAAESRAIQLEEQITTNEKKYKYYEDLLTLNEKLFAKLNNKTSSYYTIQQFSSFLGGLVDGCKNKELKDYSNSYIKKIENRISASLPITENPSINAVSKGTVKTSGIVFAIALMLSVFVSFLLEGLKKSQAQLS